MPAIGSSRSRKRGLVISARASSSSLRWPPESVPAYASASLVRLKTSSSSIASSRTSVSRLREAAGRKITLRSFSPGWLGAASIMLSITGIAEPAPW